jgi:hypothetical protein
LIYRTHRRSHLDQCPRVRWRTAGGLCRSSAGPYLYRSATVVRHSRWTRCYEKSSNSESPCDTATWPARADGPRYRATTRSRSTVRRTWQKTDPDRRSLEPCDLPDVRLRSAQTRSRASLPWCMGFCAQAQAQKTTSLTFDVQIVTRQKHQIIIQVNH